MVLACICISVDTVGSAKQFLHLQVKHKLLWVWPDASPNNQLEAMSQEVPVIKELLDEEQCVWLHPW